MNIAIVCFSRARGGLESILVTIADALQKRDHNVVFVSPANSPLEHLCGSHSVPHRTISPSLKYLDLFSASSLASILRKHSIDIVLVGISRDISTTALATRMARRGRIIFFQQMQFGLDKKDLFHRWTYGNLAHWICLTKQMKDAVIQKTTVPPKKITVIPFGVNPREFDPNKYSKEESRAHFGIPGDKFVLATIGRLDKQKGQEHLLHAMPLLLKRRTDVHALIVGEETQGESGYKHVLEALAQSLQIEEAVQFLPFTQEVPRLLAGIDLLILPSLNETFGYIVVEAMAMGKPVIGTNAGGVPEIIEDGETGLLMNPADPNDLAEKALMLMENDQLRNKMSASARKRVLDHFDFERNILQLESIFQEVIT